MRAPQIKALVEDGALQLSLFDEQDLVEINSPEFPGERLVCCHNPVLAAERARKRGELLAATEKELTPIAAATRPRAAAVARARTSIALRVGKVINHYKMAKHFTLEITDESFTFTRNTEAIAAEAALDGIYVLRTSLPTDTLAHRRRGGRATRTSPTSSGSSAPSTANSTCGPSGTGWPTGCAPTCSCACCPTTSAGT